MPNQQRAALSAHIRKSFIGVTRVVTSPEGRIVRVTLVSGLIIEMFDLGGGRISVILFHPGTSWEELRDELTNSLVSVQALVPPGAVERSGDYAFRASPHAVRHIFTALHVRAVHKAAPAANNQGA